MINEKRTVIVRDVELHWAKLNKAVDSMTARSTKACSELLQTCPMKT